MSSGIESVLIVDDEPDIRRICEVLLTRQRAWSITAVASGSEALGVLQTLRPDVILLDVMMPDCDGPTVLRQIRELPEVRGVPVLFLTAKVQQEDLERYRALGAAGTVCKPFDPRTLAGEIEQFVQDHAASSL